MESKICMNASCRKTTSTEWKRGWALRSGGFADLCYSCGSAYENGHFCETFHTEQSGWRECYLCSKRLHCGCIASASLIQLLDYGGVGCTTCANRYKVNLAKRSEPSDGYGALSVKALADRQAKALADRQVKAVADRQATNFGSRLSQLCQIMEANEPDLFSSPSLRSDTRSTQAEEKQEEILPQHGETGKETQPALEFASFFKPHGVKSILNITSTQASLVQPSLGMGLRVTTSSGQLLSNGSVEGKEQKTASSTHKVSESSISTITTPLGSGKTVVSQMRIAGPPVEGRGKNHLLPRYRPRMSDQELQKISGDLNSSVVPLFEKILSASDAGRIGRLVLPKACAEAYFPTINQSEGIPLKIQDVTGKEWTFQFRFWPNNNSRMYVLEGVTPCIQSMQLQAGDTVIFSRIEPGGKLVMGFRKTKNPGEQQVQGLQTSALTNGNSSGETLSPGFSGSLSTVNGKDTQANGMSEKVLNGERNDIKSSQIREKKRTRRNIGSKSKRLLMRNEEATALQLTWEEAQDLLRPPPGAKPTIVTVEGHEFEEYDEPPVFGKRTFFTSSSGREQEQWGQCDNCSKWRRLPVDVLLPSNWTCSENVWDSSRCSCSVAEEFSHQELENLLRSGKDFKKQRTAKHEPSSGLDTLACAAVLGGDLDEPSLAGATTRHPRHRPGCTCIVCIQPPSGKGKHQPDCNCNVCLTVKRRFKTLMQRKKNRQLERESKAAMKDDHQNLNHRLSDSSGTQSLAWIDLNIRPHRDELQKTEDKNPRSGETSLLLLADQVKENEEAENEPGPGDGEGGSSSERKCRDAAAASALVAGC